MNCPHCGADLTPEQVQRLNAARVSAMRKRKAGGATYKRHSKAAGSRCKCPKCNAKRRKR